MNDKPYHSCTIRQYVPSVPSSSILCYSLQYVTPRVAILERDSDVIIVGRGITQAEDPAAAAQTYKEEAFAAYKERIGQN